MYRHDTYQRRRGKLLFDVRLHSVARRGQRAASQEERKRTLVFARNCSTARFYMHVADARSRRGKYLNLTTPLREYQLSQPFADPASEQVRLVTRKLANRIV